VTHKAPAETFVRRRNDRLTSKQQRGNTQITHRNRSTDAEAPTRTRNMRRLILTFLAVISLLLGVSAAIGSQATPAQAETTIPMYGYPATLDGSPIGGGVGYSNIIDPSQADYVVSTAAELKAALAAATYGQVVYIADGTTVTFDSSNYWGTSGVPSGYYVGCYVPAGVTLAGGRGGTGTAAVLTWSSSYSCPNTEALVWCEDDANVIGLNLAGANETTSIISGKKGYGVRAGNDTEVANCEIQGCTHGGVVVLADILDVWVHHNYIHHNQQSGYGYGVVLYPLNTSQQSSAIVEGNHFAYGRHMVSGGVGRAHWIARYNYVDGGCTSSVFDQHGSDDYNGDASKSAGGNIQIYNNTSVLTGQNFVNIRGQPYPGDNITVHHNWSYSLDHGAVIQQFIHTPGLMYNAYDGASGPNGGAFIQMSSYDNWWGTAPPPSTNVAPVLNAIGNKSIREGTSLSFAISASDVNGDALTYSASNLPVGATFNATNRTFSWTPSLSQAGVYAGVHFQVSDGQMTDYEEITITVSDGVRVDVNSDGSVNSLDMIRVGQHWNETGVSGWIPEDINRDGTVNVLDATLVGQFWTG